MRKLKAPGKTAKNFLTQLAPVMLQACGVNPIQSFFGVRVDIAAELNKRIALMTEETAESAIAVLKELLNQWEP